MTTPIDITVLPANAQKILDPNGPAPLKGMAAKGLVPGLKPGEILAVVIVLSQGVGATADSAKNTLANLPTPLINGALGGDLQPGVLDVLGPIFAKDAGVTQRILTHPAMRQETVAEMAAIATEGVCELIATNEERLLAYPPIIEKLYLNKNCRMSTADRILELAVRHDIELNIPAYAQAKAAIAGELVMEQTEEPTFDDVQFVEAKKNAEDVLAEDEEDTHELDELTGTEVPIEKMRPLHAIWADLRPPAKIRLLLLAAIKEYDESGKEISDRRLDAKALRMLGVRDANPLVAVSAINTPGMGDSEVQRISGMRNVCEEVLREIASKREWTRHYMVKYNLVANPRTPFGQASKFIAHMREGELKNLAKSKEVAGAVQTAARQALQRKGK